MTDLNIRRPIGFDEICNRLEDICRKGKNYRYIDKHPGPFLFFMDEGNGITTLLEYVEDIVSEFGVLDFDSGIDKMIEMKFTTDLTPFEVDRNAAIYMEQFKGIEAHILTEEFAQSFYPSKYKEYLDKVKEINKYAMVVFFVPQKPSKTMEELVTRLKMTFGQIETFNIPTYATFELAQISIRHIEENGIYVDQTSIISKIIELIEILEINTVQEVIVLAEKIELASDYSTSPPLLKSEVLDEMMCIIKNNEVKIYE